MHDMWHLSLFHAPSPGIGRPGFLQSDRCEIRSHCWFAVHLSPWGEHVLLSWQVFQVFLSMIWTWSSFMHNFFLWPCVFMEQCPQGSPCWSMGQNSPLPEGQLITIVCPCPVLPTHSSGLFPLFPMLTLLWVLNIYPGPDFCPLPVFPENCITNWISNAGLNWHS